jgi:hypothetical protein
MKLSESRSKKTPVADIFDNHQDMPFEERIAKLFREFPTEVYEPDEMAIVVIKSHLLAEHYLDAILELLAYDHRPLDLDGNTGFAMKVKLVRAFTQFGSDDRWAVVDSLNKLRNMVAHSFKGPDREHALKKLRIEVIRLTSRNPKASDNPDYDLKWLSKRLALSAFRFSFTFCKIWPRSH